MKHTNSWQVESKTSDRISQHVESDATSLSLDRSISFEIIPAMTQGGDHVANQDADDDKDQGHAMGDVQEFIAVGRTWKNLRKSVGSLLT